MTIDLKNAHDKWQHNWFDKLQKYNKSKEKSKHKPNYVELTIHLKIQG